MTITRDNSESFPKCVNLFKINQSGGTHVNYFSGNTSSQDCPGELSGRDGMDALVIGNGSPWQ